MLKMIKYEYRRALTPLSIVFIIFGVLELYFLIATGLEKESHTAIAMGLLFFASGAMYLFVLINGIVSYKNDLSNKDGYLLFMAPVSTYGIIGAKLISILLTGLTLVALIGVFGMIDYSFAASVYHFEGLIDLIKEMFEAIGSNLAESLFGLLAFIVTFLIQFFTVTTVAYLALSLSATVLQNKKGKTFMSFALFFGMWVAIEGIAASIMKAMGLENMGGSTFGASMLSMSPIVALYFVVAVICFFLTGLLLDKKISL